MLQRGSDQGLGFSIVGGVSTKYGNFPIFVKNVFDNGSAQGLLSKGDQIIAVNETSLQGVTHEQAVEILKNVIGKVKLTILTQPRGMEEDGASESMSSGAGDQPEITENGSASSPGLNNLNATSLDSHAAKENMDSHAQHLQQPRDITKPFSKC